MPIRRSASPRRRPRWVLGGLVVLLLVGAGVVLAATRLRAARSDLYVARDALTVARDAVVARDHTQAQARFDVAAAALERARRRVDHPAVAALRPLPLLGQPSRAGRAAVEAGEHVLAAGRLLDDTVEGFPTEGRPELNGQDLSAFHDAAVRSSAAVRTAEARVDRAREAIAGSTDSVFGPVSRPAKAMLDVVDDARRRIDHVRRGLDVLADLTAPDADVRLLVVSQDTFELRPTGGFIGSFGVLHFERGRLELEDFADVGTLRPPDPPAEAPAGLAEFLARPYDMSEANWWPDFPTSAEDIATLFTRQRGVRVDAVLALTEVAIGRLLTVTGPIQLDDYREPVVAEGFADRALYEVELKQPHDTPRKKFLVDLSHDLFARLFSLRPDQVPGLTRVVAAAIGTGDAQLWFADEARRAALDGTAISGALPDVARDEDFLMVVDANLSASKANRGLRKALTYTVGPDEEDDDRLRATLTITARNEDPPSVVNPYYNGYVRVYAPAGSTLVETGGNERDDGPARDGPFHVFSVQLYVRPQEARTLTVSWLLPPAIRAGDYHLTWMRQAGTTRDELRVVGRAGTTVLDPNQRRFRSAVDLRGS